jgi:hypothetical protein
VSTQTKELDDKRHTVFAVVSVLIATWFAFQLIRHHMPVIWVVYGMSAAYAASYTTLTRLHEVWRNSRTVELHPATDQDVWQGDPLQSRRLITKADLHYRIYDANTGRVLSFGSNDGPGALNRIVIDAFTTQAENPAADLYVEQFDGPAYPTGDDR